MLTHRSCVTCGRSVRLSTAIQPPRCPACRLAVVPSPPETRPCQRCHLPLPVTSPALCCAGCQVRQTYDTSCLDCGKYFAGRRHIIRCPDCRSRRLTAPRTPVSSGRFQASFDPFTNSFQQPNNHPRRRSRPSRQRISLISPSSSRSRIQPIDCDPSFLAVNEAIAFLRQEHESRVQASETFPSPICSSYIRSSFIRFDNEIEIAS